ncbi:DEAD/DEAH box helicase [Arenimonas donghaensis]|uniref:DEAD/DEAH box helicase n=1 Tax=Arenimonas donghaensis TaxID=375061 RepID=UPI000B052375|nr:SNF2-related protein [Arenimonas donghaensis]
MSTEPIRFLGRVLRRTDEDSFAVYRAALEWDLEDPIVIESRDDLRSESRWTESVKPYSHQVSNLITFCRRLPVTLLADDVGLGKTISAGLVMSELQSRQRLARTLIVCPKLLGPQWQEELLTKFGIESVLALGKDLLDAEPLPGSAVITTYNSARLYLERLPSDRFQMLVLDEAHKLRNLYGVEKPPQVAKVFRKALEQRRFRFVLMLTATPIHNRLWDIYSLVDLLTVARGHKNPFGTEGVFARRFIADSRDKARQLREDARDEFRSIVYSYMSRVRRGDAKLYFPDRRVQMHRVMPTAGESKLIAMVGSAIQRMNKLAQISILQALASSPDALSAQLRNMARNGTVPPALSADVEALARSMPPTSKLRGLLQLASQLQAANPSGWRMVVFTTRVETQTTIRMHLENNGIRVGTINGSTASRNVETIREFRQSPPGLNVIVSTEAGSEGVNLQAANVLVNYDLPWNPMIVEQRIGRIQRLASEHALVNVFNITLQGTFEEYIVGRLLEKLQMASHAIGDIESLLEASGMDDEGKSLEDHILALVLDSLQGKDTQRATRLTEESIERARIELEAEQENINSLLGSADDARTRAEARPPKFPPLVRSMTHEDFTISALRSLGAVVSQSDNGTWIAEEDRTLNRLRFNESGDPRATLYAPGSAAFSRLVDRVVASGCCRIEDEDHDARETVANLVNEWLSSFDACLEDVKLTDVDTVFSGSALLRVRATVAHDSYERLVDAACDPSEHRRRIPGGDLSPIPALIESATEIGAQAEKLADAALNDPGVAEFRRFYLDRRRLELESAGDEDRKRKKLEADFTPRVEAELVGLSGRVWREAIATVRYSIDGSGTFSNAITVRPSDQAVLSQPPFATCAVSGRRVPETCLAKCDISGAMVLPGLLVQSQVSGRRALEMNTARCAESGKLALLDELAQSAVSGLRALSGLMRRSDVSGRLAEPRHFQRCEFSGAECLSDELGVSELSGRKFRKDQISRSEQSGRTGHTSEFTTCSETGAILIESEGERCGLSGSFVRAGILEACGVSARRVLPRLLHTCSVTGTRAIGEHLVQSSIGGGMLLTSAATRSKAGKFCTPDETQLCQWTSRTFHPDDLRTCQLLGIPVHFEHTAGSPPQLKPLRDLLDGVTRGNALESEWTDIARLLSVESGRRSAVKNAVASSDGSRVAIYADAKSLLGLRSHVVGALYCPASRNLIGKIVSGKRERGEWRPE